MSETTTEETNPESTPACDYCDEPAADAKQPERCGKCTALACEEHFDGHWCVRVAGDAV
jgi:hypothetical protein